MTRLVVEEMSCNHCVGRIGELLKGMNVKHEIDLATKSVSVEADQVVVDQIIEELDDIGFTAIRA